MCILLLVDCHVKYMTTNLRSSGRRSSRLWSSGRRFHPGPATSLARSLAPVPGPAASLARSLALVPLDAASGVVDAESPPPVVPVVQLGPVQDELADLADCGAGVLLLLPRRALLPLRAGLDRGLRQDVLDLLEIVVGAFEEGPFAGEVLDDDTGRSGVDVAGEAGGLLGGDAETMSTCQPGLSGYSHFWPLLGHY